MKTETKFNIGDTLHVICGSKPRTFDVKKIIISDDGIEYGENVYQTFPENVCFTSREELCDFIMKG